MGRPGQDESSFSVAQWETASSLCPISSAWLCIHTKESGGDVLHRLLDTIRERWLHNRNWRCSRPDRCHGDQVTYNRAWESAEWISNSTVGGRDSFAGCLAGDYQDREGFAASQISYLGISPVLELERYSVTQFWNQFSHFCSSIAVRKPSKYFRGALEWCTVLLPSRSVFGRVSSSALCIDWSIAYVSFHL